MKIEPCEVWFVTGSQHLYGPETLRLVAENSRQVAEALDGSESIPVPVVAKPVLTDPEAIRKLCLDANSDPKCAGLILWMHTFSPAKMWIGGLSLLKKPIAHLHTQFNRDLPWGEIDMDFMNLNQAAHGDREAGFIHTRLRLRRNRKSKRPAQKRRQTKQDRKVHAYLGLPQRTLKRSYRVRRNNRSYGWARLRSLPS